MLCERCLDGVSVMDDERKVTSGNGRKHQVHLLQVAVFLSRCHPVQQLAKLLLHT